MEIKGKVHCFFEQSGTFKREFIKLGIPAEDYDIQDNFGETDHKIDLFNEIENAYRGGESVFDSITCDDLIMAFFPCIYFESMSCMYFDFSTRNNDNKPLYGKIGDAIDRLQVRTKFHTILYKLVWVVDRLGLRLVLENPHTKPNYLIDTQNFPPPTMVDKNRMMRGDYYIKPTAYWFFGCAPTYGFTQQKDKKQRVILEGKKAAQAGLCSEERSMISPDYARNFICDFILGKEQRYTQMAFDF